MSQSKTLQIVVGCQRFSPQAYEAFVYAMQEATRHEAPSVLRLLAVIDKPLLAGLLGAPPIQLASEALDALEEMVSGISQIFPPRLSLSAHVRLGEPAQEILRFAEETSADLIVLGAPQLTASTAATILSGARCPVTIARAKTYPANATLTYQPEPPCPDCLAERDRSANTERWCERHRSKNKNSQDRLTLQQPNPKSKA